MHRILVVVRRVPVHHYQNTPVQTFNLAIKPVPVSWGGAANGEMAQMPHDWTGAQPCF
jgi:hypothetical protein